MFNLNQLREIASRLQGAVNAAWKTHNAAPKGSWEQVETAKHLDFSRRGWFAFVASLNEEQAEIILNP